MRQKRNFGPDILPGQKLKEETMRGGGILIADGLFSRIPSFTDRISPEIYFDAIMDNYADSVMFPLHCTDTGSLLYFALLNLGAKISFISKDLDTYIFAPGKLMVISYPA